MMFGLCALWLLLVVSSTDGDSIVADSLASCSPQPDSASGSSVLEMATSTGCIHHRPKCSKRFFDNECQTRKARQYRTADGSCNHAFNLGSANTPVKRLIPSAYWDSISLPRSHGKDGFPLPAATDVSRTVLLHKHKTTRQLTAMYMTWGQFIDHDMDLTPVSMKAEGKITCCGPNGTFPDYQAHPQCFPIKLSAEDADKRFRGDCMEFVRSVPSKGLNGHPKVPREQVNSITSFIDGSMIYGSSEAMQRTLRETAEDGESGARLKTSGNNLLPRDNDDGNCIIPPGKEEEMYCFQAGDTRVNVQPGLIAMHTIWVRLHNYIVEQLRGNGYSEDQLFQEARKIVVAILQNIHYKEFVPLVIGSKTLERYGLIPAEGSGQRCSYSAHVDPSISNAFATAAFRFGHSNIPEHLNVDRRRHRFQDLFFRIDLIFEDFDGVVRALLRGNTNDLAEDADRFIVEDVTDHLFEPVTQLKGEPSRGLDLAALNIQRGRDHGLPPYDKFREFCGLKPMESFEEFDDDVALNLSSLYRSVDDVDLFVGGLLEPPEEKADVGPTFACILAQQFQALKVGDRFFYETDRKKEGFTDDQLDVIRQISAAHVICRTTNLRKVPQNVFHDEGNLNRRSCKDLNQQFPDFSAWN